MYVVLLQSWMTALTGGRLRWQKLRRTGVVEAPGGPGRPGHPGETEAPGAAPEAASGAAHEAPETAPETAPGVASGAASGAERSPAA